MLATVGNLLFLSLGFAIAGRAGTGEAANNLTGLATAPLRMALPARFGS